MWTGPMVEKAIRQTAIACPYVTVADEHMAQVGGQKWIEADTGDRQHQTVAYVRLVAWPYIICGASFWRLKSGLTVVCTRPEACATDRSHGYEHVTYRMPEEARA